MKKSRLTDSQKIAIVQEYEAEANAQAICRRHGISTNTLRSRREKYLGVKQSDVARMKALEEENARLKQIVANLTLDLEAAKFVNSKNW